MTNPYTSNANFVLHMHVIYIARTGYQQLEYEKSLKTYHNSPAYLAYIAAKNKAVGKGNSSTGCMQNIVYANLFKLSSKIIV